jgi:hypothetical protein
MIYIATQQPPSPDDKVSCRINREGNSLTRICLTKAQWRKLDARCTMSTKADFATPLADGRLLIRSLHNRTPSARGKKCLGRLNVR